MWVNLLNGKLLILGQHNQNICINIAEQLLFTILIIMICKLKCLRSSWTVLKICLVINEEAC